MSPSSSSQASVVVVDVEPVYRFYIKDRVTGNSYVPREYRKGGSKHGQRYVDAETGESPTDCKNRPPHWTCYLPPLVQKFPAVFEQNAACRRIGKIGFDDIFKNRHIARRRLFFIAFTFNLAALALTLSACMAFTLDYDLLVRSSFSRGEARIQQLNSTILTLNVGFRAIAVDDPSNQALPVSSNVVTFDTFCDRNAGSSSSATAELQRGLCGDCRNSSYTFIVTCCFNLFIILKNMFSDITRMYPNYDLNCPSTAGSLFGALSVFLGIYTIWSYQRNCFKNIEENVELGETSANATVTFEWWRGPGLTHLGIATMLRFMDAVCNLAVPTPSITRYVDQQKEYELMYGELGTIGKVEHNNHGGEFGSAADVLLLASDGTLVAASENGQGQGTGAAATTSFRDEANGDEVVMMEQQQTAGDESSNPPTTNNNNERTTTATETASHSSSVDKQEDEQQHGNAMAALAANFWLLWPFGKQQQQQEGQREHQQQQQQQHNKDP